MIFCSDYNGGFPTVTYWYGAVNKALSMIETVVLPLHQPDPDRLAENKLPHFAHIDFIRLNVVDLIVCR